MSKKKIMIIVVSALTLIALLVIAVPVVASDTATTTPPAQITPANKAGVLVRLLLVQNEAKVDAFLAKAVAAGKITTDQSTKIKDFWTAHHGQFLKNVILGRLLGRRTKVKFRHSWISKWRPVRFNRRRKTK